MIDIDDDGDLVIDNVDRSEVAQAAQVTHAAQAPREVLSGWIKSILGRDLFTTANANSPALVGAIDRALPDGGMLFIGIEPGDFVELDCGGANQSTPRAEGLIYCSRGGTGTIKSDDGSIRTPFPDAFDPDGNGMGNLTPPPQEDSETALGLVHGATAAQIGTGDVLVQRVTDNGVQSQFTETVQYVFATVPALVSYDDGRGGSATVQYPVPWGGPGSMENGFPVTAGPNGHVVVRLTFWRPQRAPIPPETAPWIDIGHLSYGVNITDTGDPCPASSLSNPSPSLAATPAYSPEGGMVTDQADDRPADPANTLSFTVDLTGCLAANGLSFQPHTTAPSLALAAETCGGDRCTGTGVSTGPDEADQILAFSRH